MRERVREGNEGGGGGVTVVGVEFGCLSLVEIFGGWSDELSVGCGGGDSGDWKDCELLGSQRILVERSNALTRESVGLMRCVVVEILRFERALWKWRSSSDCFVRDEGSVHH